MLVQMGGPALGSRQDHSALAGGCSSSQDYCIQAQLLVLFTMVAGMVLVPVVLVADGAEALWTTISSPAVFTHLTTFTFLTFSRELLLCLVCSLIGGATSLGMRGLGCMAAALLLCTQGGLISGTATGHLYHHQRLSWRHQEGWIPPRACEEYFLLQSGVCCIPLLSYLICPQRHRSINSTASCHLYTKRDQGNQFPAGMR